MDVVPDFVVEEAARRFALLGDPTRLRVVSAVHRRGEACVSDLAIDCDTSPSNASQHLQLLLLGGIVKRRRQGRLVLYRLADDTIESLCTIVCASVLERARILSA
ncbi:MAG: ArsR/SmtB family transcription factor [Candidatus Limnocylindrales bacterium]